MSFAAVNKNVLYSFKDLEILAQENNYQEFFQHCLDIRPTLRSERWAQLVDQMAGAWGNEVKKAATLTSAQFAFMQEMFQLSPLKTNGSFKLLRADLGYKYLVNEWDKTEAQSQNVLNSMKTFWSKDTTSHELGLKLMKFVLDRTGDINEAWYFVSEIMKTPQSGFYCKRSDIQPIVLQKLTYSLNNSITPVRKTLQNLLHQDCWKEIKSQVKDYYQKLPQDSKGPFYTLLKEEELIPYEEKDLFAFTYILSGPGKSDAFNETWNTITALKDSSERREILLSQLKELPTLPDGVFGSYDLEKKRIIVNFIQKVVPEYFDFYAKTCIQYLKGEVKFSQGNPTLNCQELFKMTEKNPDLVNPVLKFQYTQAIKL